MGATKSTLFTKQQNELATIAKALAHPARIAIIQHLIKVNSCICNHLVDEIPLAQPTISQHLKELKNAEIIQGTVDGKSICYCLHPEKIEQLNTLLTTMIQHSTNKCINK